MDRSDVFGFSKRTSKIGLLLGMFLFVFTQYAFAKEITIISQIHNAPGWLAAHAYTYSSGPPVGHKTRVVNGDGWNGSAFLPNHPLNAYELTSAGSCTSASSGGPSGMGSSISDGTCVWKYLSDVDYVTLTGWLVDSGVTWKKGTAYAAWDVVLSGSPLTAYMEGCGFICGPPPPGCVSAIDPSTAGTRIGADGCQWINIGAVTYTSGTNHIPVQRYNRWEVTGCMGATAACTSAGNNLYITAVGGTAPIRPLDNNLIVGGAAIAPAAITSQTSGTSGNTGIYKFSGSAQQVPSEQMVVTYEACGTWSIANQYTAHMWNDREYVAGSNGEMGPSIWSQNHDSQHNDSDQCHTGPGSFVTFTAAAGEDFATTLAADPSIPIAGYDPNLGVAIRADSGPAICTQDNSQIFSKIQVKSATVGAIDGMGLNGCGAQMRSCNNCRFLNIIADGGSKSFATISTGADEVVANSLIIARGLGGIFFDYPGYALNNTVINLGTDSHAVGISAGYNWVFVCGVNYSGNAIFGFPTAFAQGFGTLQNIGKPCVNSVPSPPTFPGALTLNGTGNATDAASGGGPGGVWIGGGVTTASIVFPGTTYKVIPSSAFVSWPGNYRISQSSTLHGARAEIFDAHFNSAGDNIGPPGDFDWCRYFNGQDNGGPGASDQPSCHYFPEISDLIGTTRPQGGKYDVGAIAYLSKAPSAAKDTDGDRRQLGK